MNILRVSLLLCGCIVSYAARIRETVSASALDTVESTSESNTSTKYCCCKKKACRPGAVGSDGTPSVYSRNADLCCKVFNEGCGYIFHDWGYKHRPPNAEYCKVAGKTDLSFTYEDSEEDKVSEVDPSELPEGSLEHTIHNYCDFDAHRQDTEEDEEQVDKQAHSAQASSASRRHEIVGALVKELSANSLDSMAKEIFSIYMCVRWAPGPDFVAMASGEVKTEQLPDKDVFELYSGGRFIPLRCTRNLNVYGDNGHAPDETHFYKFEEHANQLSKFFEREAKGALIARLQKIHGLSGDTLKSEARLFDQHQVEKLANCDQPETQTSTFKADAQMLLDDCQSMKFWEGKLTDWEAATPFKVFMSPTEAAVSAAKLTSGEQVLICFGKRVASQLHRRENGDHLLTDQSAVGCHGFWDFDTTAKMLSRIVQLWRPPTCQLAAMELDMKIKIMDLIADMNSRLFDALPAILMDEVDDAGDTDGNALKVASTAGVIGSVFSSIVSAFSGMRGSYTRLGLLLGNTVVKWAVCPLKPIDADDWKANDKLDSVLGTEDDIARYYAEQAYAKWTGHEKKLPGEVCEVIQGSPTQVATPRCQECHLGFLQENVPEPYHDDKFICPVRPLLPARQQLEVFKDKHDICLMHMTNPQWMAKDDWVYRGRRAHLKQYNSTTNDPTKEYEIIKITKLWSTVDKDFGLKHDFARFGRRCTEEEFAATPDWCSPPHVENQGGYLKALAAAGESALGVAGGVVGVVGKGIEMAGYKEETPPGNGATSKRFGNWLYGAKDSMRRGFGSWWDENFGNAKTRYTKLYNKRFGEVEAGELLHSASYQKEERNTGADSKNHQRYNRYAVTCPCQGYNPEREFKLEYKWSEHALVILARKEAVAVATSPTFEVQLQSAKILRMSGPGDAWLDGYTFIRAAAHGTAMPAWYKTGDAFLRYLVGITDRASDSSASADDMYGFSAHFSCGPRVDIYKLTRTLQGGEMKGSFKDCVTNGVKNNMALREAKPTALFHPTETVIRVNYAALQTCNHESISLDDNHAEFLPTEAPQEGQKPATAKRYFYEKQNAVHKAFTGAQGIINPGACAGTKGAQKDLLDMKANDANYRGMLTGRGLPKETRTEILMDPEDVASQLGW